MHVQAHFIRAFLVAFAASFALSGMATAQENHLRWNHQHFTDHWESVGRMGAVWVLMDTVKGNDSLAALRMYWSNTAADDKVSRPTTPRAEGRPPPACTSPACW